MKSWHWIGKDDGRSGLEWAFSVRHTGIIDVWIPGTDHIDDWKHHLKIGLIEAADGIWVTRADLLLAADIVRQLPLEAGALVRIGGHSWGGAVGALLVWILRRRGVTARGWIYGPKMVGNQQFVNTTQKWILAYRRRGDVIPFMIPWLARYQMDTIGGLTWPWKAHGPATYYSQMEKDGFR